MPYCRCRPIFLPNNFFNMDFCLCGAILNLKTFCIGAIPDIMIELIVYGNVPQSRQSYLLQGPSKEPHNLTSTGPHLF
jgi:hypothetical protein